MTQGKLKNRIKDAYNNLEGVNLENLEKASALYMQFAAFMVINEAKADFPFLPYEKTIEIARKKHPKRNFNKRRPKDLSIIQTILLQETEKWFNKWFSDP